MTGNAGAVPVFFALPSASLELRQRLVAYAPLEADRLRNLTHAAVPAWVLVFKKRNGGEINKNALGAQVDARLSSIEDYWRDC